PGGVAHVAGGDQIDGAAQAVALDGRQHRLAAAVDGVEGRLQLEDLAAQGLGAAADVLAHQRGGLGQQVEVDAGGKVLTGTAEHHHTDLIRAVDPFKDVDDLRSEEHTSE